MKCPVFRSRVRPAVPAGQPGEAGGGGLRHRLRANHAQDQMPSQTLQKVRLDDLLSDKSKRCASKRVRVSEIS